MHAEEEMSAAQIAQIQQLADMHAELLDLNHKLHVCSLIPSLPSLCLAPVDVYCCFPVSLFAP
jgi:hypothetical protein